MSKYYRVYADVYKRQAITEELLAGMDSMDIVNNALIPALDKIGEEFEKGTLFLPQLIMAAGVA